MKARTIDVGGPVFLADFGGEGRPIVLLHGLGASHTSWLLVGEALAKRGRVIAPDLIGFGRTPLGGRAPSMEANVALAAQVMEREGLRGATVIGNSMGGYVAVALAAARPDLVAKLVLVAPALPRPLSAPFDPVVAAMFSTYLVPGLGEMFMRTRMAAAGPERILRDTLAMCGVDPATLPAEMWEATLALAHERTRYPWAAEAFLGSARSLLKENARREKVYQRIRGLAAPALLTQGTHDRLVPPEVSEAAARQRSDWRVELMPGIGHVPQLQAPERWLGLVTEFLPS